MIPRVTLAPDEPGVVVGTWRLPPDEAERLAHDILNAITVIDTLRHYDRDPQRAAAVEAAMKAHRTCNPAPEGDTTDG